MNAPPFRRTGKMIEGEDLGELRRLLVTAQTTPVMAISMKHGLEEGGFSGQAWTRLHKFIEAKAISAGLPELSEGQYGCDTESGEILDLAPGQ